jgi:hypothetical protein
MSKKLDPLAVRNYARDTYANGNIEVDDDAKLAPVINEGKLKGVWVEAWVWVPAEDIPE